MRRNYTVRRSSLEEYYDVVYVDCPEEPELRKVIDHTRKTIFINVSGDLYGEVREIRGA